MSTSSNKALVKAICRRDFNPDGISPAENIETRRRRRKEE
jgi:hypothetical protein